MWFDDILTLPQAEVAVFFLVLASASSSSDKPQVQFLQAFFFFGPSPQVAEVTKKNLLLPMNSKLLNVYYSFILASINYVYMYLTLSTSACLWNQLFMETHNLKKKFCILHVSGIYSRLYRKKLPQCISNSSSIYHHVQYQPNKQIKETLPLSDEGSGFLRSSSSNKASSSTNSTSSSNMSDADKVHTLATSSCVLSTERKIANKADYGTIYY